MSMSRSIKRNIVKSKTYSTKENHDFNFRRFKTTWRKLQIKAAGKLKVCFLKASNKKLTDIQKYIFMRLYNMPWRKRSLSKAYNMVREEMM